MLNNEKIILMTKLALYEQGEGKKKIPIGKYFKSDYIGMRLLSSFIYINIAYFICVALWAIVKGEELINDLTNIKLSSSAMIFVVVYLIVVVIYMFISYIYFTYKFKSIRRSLKEYNSQLKQLRKIQEREIEALSNELDMELQMEGEE